MSDMLNNLLDAVVDSATLLAFVDALRLDRVKEIEAQKTDGIDRCGRGPNGWENHTIEDFLEAATAWAEPTYFGRTQGLSDSNPWRMFASFLYCGKIYE